MKLLLTGASGQLGQELLPRLQALGEVLAPTHAQCDLTQAETLRETIRACCPAVIVNAAAYTQVDRAESEPDLAHAINAQAPGIIGEEAARCGAAVVHFSTDYVFDGRLDRPYTETDPPAPLNVYGQSKLAGEHLLANALPRHLILRTSWVFGRQGGNFLKTILKLAGERDALEIVSDQLGAPTAADWLAESTLAIVSQLHGMRADDPRWGCHHLCAAGTTSWYGYACHIMRRMQQLGMPLRLQPEKIRPIASADFSSAARRPANSQLDTTRLQRDFGITPPPWQDGVDRILQQLLNSGKNNS